MLFDFIDLSLHLDSVTVVIRDVRVVLGIRVRPFHLSFTVLISDFSEARAYLFITSLFDKFGSRSSFLVK